ncbi:Rrf2 family transcriptional regulator [Lacrimispora sp. 38-1]|uniref:Rrf2 family transcriptional regulator n=1 Tax=Lacrimispora sp. 38-1 TaxID=3125778 RepID=UPI003CF96610
MRINTKFPVAIHILAVVGLAPLLYNEKPTSAAIALSVNTNPVVIRRINALLKTAGLINVRAGVGGVELLKSPEDISLRVIFDAVQSDEAFFDLHHKVNPKCKIGSVINLALVAPLHSVQLEMELELEKYTLFDIMKDIATRNGMEL